MKSFNIFCISIVSALLLWNISYTQTSNGTIKGTILEADTKLPLAGANILIKDSNMGAMSDSEGKYVIENVPIGNHILIISYIGYEKVIKADIIVRPERISFVDAELHPSLLNMDEVVVSSGYYSETKDNPVSATNFSAEEIRRAPGSAGDVSRIIMGLPSVAKINDTKNSLIVRGGSPVENAFYLDGIEIPNINHYPVQGSSDGPIGLINVDFLKDVNFLTGGFSTAYGDRLSSVMELKFREGNRDEFDLQFDLSMQGMGATLEGPLADGEGSYMFSARRSYLDFVFKATDIKGPIPTYSDFQGKIVYDISDKHKLSILNVLSSDYSNMDKDQGFEFESNVYGKYNMLSNTFGMNWQYLWGADGYSTFTASHTIMNYDYNYWETRTGNELYTNKSIEQQINLRNNNHYNLNKTDALDFGADIKFNLTDYRNLFKEYSDRFGNTTPELPVFMKFNSYKAGLFFDYLFEPAENLKLSTGGRLDYFNYNESFNFSPRVSITYNFSPQTSVSGSAGLFYQTLPFIILTQNDEFKKLNNPKAAHYILGLSHYLTEDTKLTLEVYDKEYSNFPLDPSQPQLFIIDQAVNESLFLSHSTLTDNGRAYTRGVELTIQKKLAKNFYGMVGASYFRSAYKDFTGAWRNRNYDNRFTFTIDGGYKPDENWEFSLRWMYAGGAPYTPYDNGKSSTSHRGVYDFNLINGKRLPDYHSLNLRIDKRFNFDSSNLVLYLSVWNVYGRENVITYTWNEVSNELTTEKMWSMLPVFGIEYEL